MNEASYIQRINKKVRCYVWKIHTSMHRGKLDCLYAWGSNHLWVEYKFQKTAPKTLDLTKKPYLSAIQQWEIKQLTNSAQKVRVLLGTPQGGYVFTPEEINQVHNTSQLRRYSDEEISQLIHTLTETPINNQIVPQ